MTVTPAQHLCRACVCSKSKNWWADVIALPSQSNIISFNSAAEKQTKVWGHLCKQKGHFHGPTALCQVTATKGSSQPSADFSISQAFPT